MGHEHRCGMCPQGTHRMEVDSIKLSRERLELLGAQGLGPPQQGHVLWATEGQGGKAESPAERERGGLPTTLLPHPPTHPLVRLWGRGTVREALAGKGWAQVPGVSSRTCGHPGLTCAPGPAPSPRPLGLPIVDTSAPGPAAAGVPGWWSGAQDTRSYTGD